MFASRDEWTHASLTEKGKGWGGISRQQRGLQELAKCFWAVCWCSGFQKNAQKSTDSFLMFAQNPGFEQTLKLTLSHLVEHFAK